MTGRFRKLREASLPHTHPCPVIGYGIEGAIQSQIDGQPAHIYKVAERFYEPANGVHRISRNASETRPAKLLAYYVCDRDAPLTSSVAGDRPHTERK